MSGPGVATVYRWELTKLRYQKRTYLGLGAAAVVGTLMVSLMIQLAGILPGLSGLHPYLLSTQFNAWQGLLRTPIDWAPIVRSAWVCALYGLPALGGAYLVFLRRDVAGG